MNDDTKMALRLACHLRDIQSEDGCDLIGQETTDLMWWVVRRFGLRPAMTDHGPVSDCPWTGKHALSECGSKWAILEFEYNRGK